MVKVNLYRRKKQKLKFSTVLFLTLILLLPIVAFRISFESIIRTNLEDLKVVYGAVLKENRLSLGSDLGQAIEMVENRNNLLALNIRKLSSNIQIVEKDFSMKLESKNVLKSFDEFWQTYSQRNKLYLKNISFNTLKNSYSFAYYELSNRNDFNSQQILSEFFENLGLYPDYSGSDKAVRKFGSFMAMFQQVNLSKKAPEAPKGK